MPATLSIFSRFIEALSVPHTSNYTEEIYQENPYKHTLYGLSILLKKYKVDNFAIRVDDKHELMKGGVPFIAEVSDDLVIVTSINKAQVKYDWYGEIVTKSLDEFLHIWTGVVLFASPNEASQEPNYEEHRKLQNVQKGMRYAFLFSVVVLLVYGGYSNGVLDSYICIPQILLNIIGVYLSYLLLLKQLHIQSNTADRICNIRKKSSCNDVLETSAAKTIGGIGWSEVGFAYFFTNLCILCLHPQWISYLEIVSFCSLGYVAWSIWYQRIKAHAWCMLCLMVQLVFVLQVACFISVNSHERPINYINIPLDVLSILGCYIIILFVLNFMISSVSATKKELQLKYNYNSLLAQEKVFNALQEEQDTYLIDNASHIVFGAKHADFVITIFSNPYCNPCANMHKRLNELVDSDCCIQYVFTSFNDNLSIINKYFIAAYQTLGAERTWKILTEWYERGKGRGEAFFKEMKLTTDTKAVTEEFELHEMWRQYTKFNATPTILVNGKKLAQPYQVENLKYFIED